MYPPAATTNASHAGARPDTIVSAPGASRPATIATANTPARSRVHGPRVRTITAQADAANVIPSHSSARRAGHVVRPATIAATLPKPLAMSTAVAKADATSGPG